MFHRHAAIHRPDGGLDLQRLALLTGAFDDQGQGHGLAVDERRQLILLFDGTMRELADTTWVIRKPNIAPSGRDWPAMVHFGWRGTLLYGGESLGDTWIYSTNSELSDELCGNQLDDDGDALSDCDDSDWNGEFCG